jgi:hypothetical protein
MPEQPQDPIRADRVERPELTADERRRNAQRATTRQVLTRREVMRRSGVVATTSPDLHARLEARIKAIDRRIGGQS